MCRKKCRSPGPCPSIRLRAFRHRITSSFIHFFVVCQLLAHPFGPYQAQISPSWVGIRPRNIPQEIFLAEKGADMCRWQRAQKCTGRIQAMSFSEAARHIWAAVDRNGQWGTSGPCRCATVNPKIGNAEQVNPEILAGRYSASSAFTI